MVCTTLLFSGILYIPDSEVLVHFDGWGPEYDYWCPASSVELHPPGWCSKHDWELQTPLSEPIHPSIDGGYIMCTQLSLSLAYCYKCSRLDIFVCNFSTDQTWTSWEHYLNETDSPATPESIFNKVCMCSYVYMHFV